MSEDRFEPDAPGSDAREIELRRLGPGDLDAIIRLNQDALGSVGPLDLERLELLVDQADQALVADVDGAIVGFVITLPPGAAYDSARYAWFEQNMTDYVYLDRVVVDASHRRRGVASQLYEAIEGAVPVALEIYDSNDISLAFHHGRGYRQVGILRLAGENNLMMVKAT